MDAGKAVANYRALAELTATMCRVARDGNWDLLAELGGSREALVEQMKLADAGTLLDPAGLGEKDRLIAEILTMDREVCDLVKSGLGQMAASLQSVRQEQRLRQTYDV